MCGADLVVDLSKLAFQPADFQLLAALEKAAERSRNAEGPGSIVAADLILLQARKDQPLRHPRARSSEHRATRAIIIWGVEKIRFDVVGGGRARREHERQGEQDEATGNDHARTDGKATLSPRSFDVILNSFRSSAADRRQAFRVAQIGPGGGLDFSPFDLREACGLLGEAPLAPSVVIYENGRIPAQRTKTSALRKVVGVLRGAKTLPKPARAHETSELKEQSRVYQFNRRYRFESCETPSIKHFLSSYEILSDGYSNSRGFMKTSISYIAQTGDTETRPTRMLTIEECQQIDAPLRDQLELLDYDIRSAFTRILSDVDRSGEDDILFLKASVTVLLSVAAGLLQRAAEEDDAHIDVGSFVIGAEKAVEWARTRRLRYHSSGEA